MLDGVTCHDYSGLFDVLLLKPVKFSFRLIWEKKFTFRFETKNHLVPNVGVGTTEVRLDAKSSILRQHAMPNLPEQLTLF